MKIFLEKKWTLPLILAAAIILRAIPVISAIGESSRLLRPDSAGYLDAAEALASCGEYPTTRRPPGYPVLAAGVYALGGNNAVLAVIQIAIGTAACWIIAKAGKEYAGEACGNAAAALMALNITAIANTPLLLSDTLFSLFAAGQFYFFIRYYRKKDWGNLLISTAIAGIATLIRPINQLIIAVIAVLIFFMRDISWQKRALHAAAAVILFTVILMPWMYRNYAAGATFAIDTNTGAMRHQNGAMLIAKVNGTNYEAEKQRLIRDAEIEFRDTEKYPDERSRENWRIREFRKMVMKHPVRYFLQHIDLRILLPDVPSFLEDFGLTTSDRGTMNVMKKDGIFAAVRHYFGPQWWIYILTLLPLLIPTGIVYAGVAVKAAMDIKNISKSYIELLILLGFAEYYLFLPGAITAPRYQLPALPCMCVIAGALIVQWCSGKNVQENNNPDDVEKV